MQAEQLLGALLPVLRLLTHKDLDQPQQLNPVLAVLHGSLALGSLKDVLQDLSNDPKAGDARFLQQRSRSTSGLVGVPPLLGLAMSDFQHLRCAVVVHQASVLDLCR